ncbi:MAG: TIR domain-containing protein [Bacteroidales bacterium]|nr:TIR domain-containing protein [Bacteroidales bacterium]
MYNIIEQAIRQHKENLYVNDIVQESDVRHAIRWVMRENPDIFWFVHQYHFDKDNGIVSLRYRCSPERCAIIQKSIDDVGDKDFQINYVLTLSQLEQVAYVYKWMLAYCNYNTNSAYNQNIDSVFIRRNSVCTGYAKAAQYLFKLLGIESHLVFGRLNNDKEDGRHCWNIVCLEGRYYHLDICLGDLSIEDVMKKAGAATIRRYGDYNYNCFCVSTEDILKTRTIEDAESLPLCDSTLPTDEVERLSHIEIKERDESFGCLLTHIGSSADIFLCTKDKNLVLKKFRGNETKKCKEEYGYMDSLKGCKHLLQLNYTYSDVGNNILAIEQSTPIVDLFCSHYYHPTLNGVLKMIKDITLGWLECQQQGIMYRDIHVCNIYKANEGSYKLGDFGSCTYELRGLRARVGNPWFMSPETYISGKFDERSAVYSIISVLYFVLNGLRPPFVNGHNEEEALQRKMNGEALPEPALLQSFPNDLAEIIMTELFARGCEFSPSKRIQTCKELLHVIDVLRSRSTLKNQWIELRFVQQDADTILDNKTIPNVYIPRNIHHRFTYGEEVERIAVSQRWSPYSEDVERTATTAATSIVDVDGNGSFEEEEVSWNDLPGELRVALEGEDDVDVSSIPMSDDVENYCRTMGVGEQTFKGSGEENSPHLNDEDYLMRKKIDELNQRLLRDGKVKNSSDGMATGGYNADSVNYPHGKLSCEPTTFNPIIHKRSFWNKLFGKTYETYSSIFAPAEMKRKSHMLVQVYLHLYEESEKVKTLAQESDRNAKRRDYIPLQCKLKKGDKVDVLLNIYGVTLLMSDKKSMVWQGSFTKCSFDYFVPKDIDVEELSCVALLSVNGVPVGEMRFITKIVDQPRQLNPEIIAHKYSKVFISYSHQDESKVKFLHEGLELGSVPHFFDRKYLKAGDVFPQVIQDYINSADLFILCWSENASKSEYVKKERLQALERAFPQVQPEKAAKLRIYPMSFEPHAKLPDDMKNYYHFGEI